VWTVFLSLMVIGLVGLVMMALPALGGHHPWSATHGHGHAIGPLHHAAHGGAHTPGHAPGIDPAVAHGAAAGAGAGASTVTAASGTDKLMLAATTHSGRWFLPSPRAVFSVLALYGACGNALIHVAHLSSPAAALVALAPALLLERILIRPVWNVMFRFRGEASSPLEQLILAEAQAVVPFRNGRGLVTAVRDGRRIQLNARLSNEQAALPVAVGQRLRIEDVDARQERVTVSVLPSDTTTNNPQ
jgi:hypothetical protein